MNPLQYARGQAKTIEDLHGEPERGRCRPFTLPLGYIQYYGLQPLGQPAKVHDVAQRGLEGPAQPLPHAEAVQRSFGRHDVSGVRAHIGGPAAAAARAMGAAAYATGNAVAFAEAPDLHTASHEAAHVVQQRGGVSLLGGVGRQGDAYEQHADAVAAAVVAGRSAETLLDAAPAGGAGAAVQHQTAPPVPASPLVTQLEQAAGNKGRVFDLLRAQGGPITAPGVAATIERLFPAGTDDRWLAQTLVRCGPEPLWPRDAIDERQRRQQVNGWAAETGGIEATLVTTAGGRPVEAWCFPGTSGERALIISGVHGSEHGGMEACEILLRDLRAAPAPPYFTVIVVPRLFPDNAATRTRERATPTNRNFPAPGTSLQGATPAAGGAPKDAAGRDILPENVALMSLIERFQPSRIATLHGANERAAAGFFADAHKVSPQAEARTRAQHADDAAAGASAVDELRGAAASRSVQDAALAQSMARHVHGTHPAAVRGNHIGGSAGPTATWSGATPGGTSLGGWGPMDVSEGGGGDRRAASVITVEIPENHRSTDRTAAAAARRRAELTAYADAIRMIFLKPGSTP